MLLQDFADWKPGRKALWLFSSPTPEALHLRYQSTKQVVCLDEDKKKETTRIKISQVAEELQVNPEWRWSCTYITLYGQLELAHGRRAQLGHHITAHDFKAPEFLFHAFTSLDGSRTGSQRVTALQ